MNFLANLPGDIDTLYILGDLFEFWIGYPEPVFHHYTPVITQLQLLKERGVRIVYFEGNHDFHLGPLFTEQLQAEVHTGPGEVTIDGVRVYLCHGDQVNSGDYGYRVLRWLLRSTLVKVMIPIVPASIASRIALFLSAHSSGNQWKGPLPSNHAALLRSFAGARFREGYDVVVAGHFHHPFLDCRGGSSDGVLVSLGDWISQYSFGEWRNGQMCLKSFSSPHDQQCAPTD